MSSLEEAFAGAGELALILVLPRLIKLTLTQDVKPLPTFKDTERFSWQVFVVRDCSFVPGRPDPK